MLEDDAFARAFERFKQLADRKIQIGEDEVRAIVEDQTGDATEKGAAGQPPCRRRQ